MSEITKPTILTETEIALLAHIPDAEVRADLAATQREIRQLRTAVKEAQEGIVLRQRLVDRLTELLAVRASAAERAQP